VNIYNNQIVRIL
jgi:hypothetical protein